MTHLGMFYIWMLMLTWMTSKKIPGTGKLRTTWTTTKHTLGISTYRVVDKKNGFFPVLLLLGYPAVWVVLFCFYQAVEGEPMNFNKMIQRRFGALSEHGQHLCKRTNFAVPHFSHPLTKLPSFSLYLDRKQIFIFL